MKKFLAVVLLTMCSIAAFSQKDSVRYKERAEELRQEIWNKAETEFKVKDIPAAMANESAVVIARAYDVVNSQKKKIKLTLLGLSTGNRINYFNTFHERVKINDKTALEEYSTLEYKKKVDKTAKVAWTKFYNTADTYVGAKIIKPDGKEIIVNTDEEVLTKDEKKIKEGKLAISGLQVGDILDYYIAVDEVQETGAEVQGPYTFIMGGEYPTLYYRIKFQLDQRAGVRYMAVNGAPSFKESKNEDGDLFLELKQKNLPKYESLTWTSPARQYPYLILQYRMVNKYEDLRGMYAAGEVKQGYLLDNLVMLYKDVIPLSEYGISILPLTYTYDYFGGKKKIKDFPQDTVIKVLFDAWRNRTFCTFSTEEINVSKEANYNRTNSLQQARLMSYYLRALDIDHDVVLVTSRNDARLQNVLNIWDMEAVIRIGIADKSYWMAFDDITTGFNEIPARFQGEEGVSLHGERTKRDFNYKKTNMPVPVIPASQNTVSEKINVQFNPSSMQQLQLQRTCILTGALRGGEQKRLLQLDYMDKQIAKNANQKTFTEKLAENKKTQKVVAEFAAAFEKERADSKIYFKLEIKQQFDEEPKDINQSEIIADGLGGNNQPLIYTSNFSMDNFVKKAGNNYILEAGKLIGSYTKLEDKERNRTIDVFMSCARTFSWEITVAIPEGFAVKGVDELNKTINNESGSFYSKATADEKNVKISVSRSFTSNFELAAAWPKVVTLLDAVYDFYGKKLLFEKKK